MTTLFAFSQRQAGLIPAKMLFLRFTIYHGSLLFKGDWGEKVGTPHTPAKDCVLCTPAFSGIILLVQDLQGFAGGHAARFFDTRSFSQAQQKFLFEYTYCKDAIVVTSALFQDTVTR